LLIVIATKRAFSILQERVEVPPSLASCTGEKMAAPIAVSDAEFDSVVSDNEWVLVDFWAPWCGPCKMIAPALDTVGGERENLVIAKVNTDTDQMNAGRMGVRSIPNLILFHNGSVVEQRTGMMDAAALGQWLAGHMD
jgi:thioredoxin